MTSAFDRVGFTVAAREDLHRLAASDRRLVVNALKIARLVDRKQLEGKDLGYYTKTGDLTDCFSVHFGAEEGEDTHRIVFRDLGARAGSVEVEVVVVETRDRDVAYLLAGLRLARLDDPATKSDAERAVHRTRKARGDPSA